MQTLFDTKQAAKYLNIPENTLKTWRCTKRVNVPYVRVGGNIRYAQSALDSFIAANTHGADGVQ